MKHQKFLKSSAAIILLLLCFAIGQALALTVQLISLQEMTLQSELVVSGRIASVEYVWEDASQRAINTVLTVEADQYVKGNGDATVTVRQLGGRIGDFGDEVPGVPQFRAGEEVVFFLVKHNDQYWIHSMALGAFRVFTNDAGQEVVYNYLPGVSVLDPATQQPLTGESVFQPATLPEFIAQIASYIR